MTKLYGELTEIVTQPGLGMRRYLADGVTIPSANEHK
jgi:hypothetical protein